MGGEVPVQQSSGFVAWIMQNGQIVAFIAQLAYWLLMIVLLAYAVWQYKRWVNYQLGVGRSGKLRMQNEGVLADEGSEDATAGSKAEKAVPVEEFVE